MTRSSLGALNIRRAHKNLPRLKQEALNLVNDLKTINNCARGGDIQLSGLREIINSATLSAIKITKELQQISSTANSVRRRDLEDAYGSFRSHAAAMYRQIGSSLQALEQQIYLLKVTVAYIANDPSTKEDEADPDFGEAGLAGFDLHRSEQQLIAEIRNPGNSLIDYPTWVEICGPDLLNQLLVIWQIVKMWREKSR